MFLKYYFFIVVTVLSMPFLITNALSADETAAKKFNIALHACEQGLLAKTPKSHSSLRILRSLLKKYKTGSELALRKDPTLKKSTTERYTGTFYIQKTFEEMFRLCESDFESKLNQAEADINQRVETRKTKQKEQQVALEEITQKIEAAMQYVNVAVDQHCVTYLRKPKPNFTATPAYKEYQKAKQKALETYPDIIKHFRNVKIVTDEEEEKIVSRSVQSWFRYCEQSFTNPTDDETSDMTEGEGEETSKGQSQPTSKSHPATPKTEVKPTPIVEEGPMPPAAEPATTPSATPATKSADKGTTTHEVDKTKISPTETPVETNAASGESNDEEYKKLLSTLQGDRLKILKQEGRIPDFSDDEDNEVSRAKTWQYEKEKEQKCTTYVFKDNTMVSSKVLTYKDDEGCPPLD